LRQFEPGEYKEDSISSYPHYYPYGTFVFTVGKFNTKMDTYVENEEVITNGFGFGVAYLKALSEFELINGKKDYLFFQPYIGAYTSAFYGFVGPQKNESDKIMDGSVFNTSFYANVGASFITDRACLNLALDFGAVYSYFDVIEANKGDVHKNSLLLNSGVSADLRSYLPNEDGKNKLSAGVRLFKSIKDTGFYVFFGYGF